MRRESFSHRARIDGVNRLDPDAFRGFDIVVEVVDEESSFRMHGHTLQRVMEGFATWFFQANFMAQKNVLEFFDDRQNRPQRGPMQGVVVGQYSELQIPAR